MRQIVGLFLAGLALGILGLVVCLEAESREAAARPVLVAQTVMGDLIAVAVSPDGHHVLTGSSEGIARLWEVATGRVVRDFAGLPEPVAAVAFSSDGSHVLVGAGGGTVRLWVTATGQAVRRFEGHEGCVNSVAFSPDGLHVVTGSEDGTARLWVTATAEAVRRLEGHEGGVNSVAFSPDGLYVVTGSEDGTARLWATATGEEVHRFVGHEEWVNSVAFSPDGRYVVTGSEDSTARLWATATGEEVRRFVGHEDWVNSVAFSPDGQYVVTGSDDSTARLWGAANGREIQRYPEHEDSVMAVAFSPDGRRVLTGSSDQTASLWDTMTGDEVKFFGGEAMGVTSVSISPDGRRVLTGSGSTVGLAEVWDATTGALVRSFEGHEDYVPSVAFSPDGQFVVTGSGDHTARLWRTETGREVQRFEGHEDEVDCVAFSPDGRYVVTGSADDTARLWDAATGKEVLRFEGHGDDVSSVAFSPDGRYVVTGSYDDTARLWTTATGEDVCRFEGHTDDVSAVAFSPDGQIVATGSDDHTARLWEAETGREVRRFEGHEDWITCVAFSPDGRRVVTGSLDRTARLWDAATGAEIRRLEGHSYLLYGVAFSQNGHLVLTASDDCTARVWEAATGRELCALVSFGEGEWAVVDPEGRYDGSNGGDVNGLHWVVGMETIALDQLKDRYYEPGLLAKILGHNDEPLREVAALTAPRLYPTLSGHVRADGQLEIQLENRGGGLGRVVVMINGKERTADARGPAPDPNAERLTLVEDLAGDPRLKPGETNRIEIFAYNEEGYLRSRGLLIDFDAKGEKEAAVPPDLYAIVAGVADYRGTVLDLQFPDDDARAFAAALTGAGRALFGVEHTHVKQLANPKRRDLLDALEWAKQADAGDILVIYLAGHGVSHGEGFYFLTAEAQTADLGDPEVRRTTTVSSTELAETISKIPALKQVLILDTCASGKFIEALMGRRATPSSQVRALERVKDRTGMFVLAGCASDRVSYEATRYGQGLLTYSLLLGMRGAALRENEHVDVSTLFGFAADKVPEFAKDIGGVQRPVVAQPRRGQTFDIGTVTAEVRSEIPLRQVRPLFSRVHFEDDVAEDDLLELSDRVESVLIEESARGRDAPLVFIDARRFPGAYRLAGKYTTTNGVTRARFRLRRDKVLVTDWITVEAAIADLPVRLVEKALEHLPPGKP